MAISQKNYVEVNSRFPARSSAERIIGGLVFTKAEVKTDVFTSSDKKDYRSLAQSYNDGNPIALNLTEVGDMFGTSTETDAVREYDFANRYYGYSSPSGQTPSTLKFVKVLASNYAPYRIGTGYAYDSFILNESDGNVYKVTRKEGEEGKDIAASENTGWDSISSFVTVTSWAESKASVSYNEPESELERVDKLDNSFGSFMFIDDYTQDQMKNVSAKNRGFGTRYLFSNAAEKGSRTSAEMVTYKSDTFGDNAGTVFIQGDGTLSAAMPMTIFAATDYDRGDQVPCHMFKQFSLETPTVKNDNDYTTLSGSFVNFYGQTQSNGKQISFYQRGFNCDGTDTSIYCNEVWFKSRCITRLMDMFMSYERVPANDEGMAMVEFRVSEVCDMATSNGAFMAKVPNSESALAIRNIVNANGGTPERANEILSGIENVGYGIFTYISQDANGDYYIHYYVFYGTADSIRFVKGDDVMVK